MSPISLLAIILSILLSIVTGLPTQLAERKEYVAVALTYTIGQPNRAPYEEPAPAELYILTSGRAKYVSSIVFDGQHYGVPLNSVECQVYSDLIGTKSLGSFTNEKPLKFGEPTTVAAFICYRAAS